MKQMIVLRTDLDMSRGKLVAQACHASLGAYKKADGAVRSEWEDAGQKKIAVKVQSEDELMELFREAQTMGITAYLVKDAGETELAPGTTTALGIGPGDDQTVDKVTKDLPLL